MHQSIFEVIIAAATSKVPDPASLKPGSYATWESTRRDDDFNVESAVRYLRREGNEVDESLLQLYGRLNRSSDTVNLRGITRIAPWIECLNVPFVNYSSFFKFRKIPRYEGILTFTTPAISDTGDVAFLELWSEDGRYAQMGRWTWLQLRRKDGRWLPDWEHLRAIS